MYQSRRNVNAPEIIGPVPPGGSVTCNPGEACKESADNHGPSVRAGAGGSWNKHTTSHDTR